MSEVKKRQWTAEELTHPELGELPSGWTWSTIGAEITELKGGLGTKKSDYIDSGILLFNKGNVTTNGRTSFDGKRKFVSAEFFAEHKKHAVEPGDLVVTLRDLSVKADFLGLVGTYRQTEPALLSQGACVVETGSNLLPPFLAYYSNSPFYRTTAKINKNGTTQVHLRNGQFGAIPIPLPPLPEQRRIVARIEELFSRLDAGVAALRHAKAQLQRYRQSVLAAAVTGQLTQAWREQQGITMDEWRQTTLGEESGLVTSGSRGWAKYYSDEGPLFIRAQNIKTDALLLDDLAHVQPPSGSEGKRTQVYEHDLLITITGANVTKSALVKEPLGEAYVSQHVALVRPLQPEHSPFLYYAIISPRNGRAFLEEKAYGAGKPGLNLTNVKDVPIALPPLAEQHQIVAEVEARTTAIDHLEAELDRQITRSNRLRQSTLSSAFKGHLTPQ